MNIKHLFVLIAFVIVCELAGGVGTVFTVSAIPTWYAELAKPNLSPPNWVFGPVWTTLYALMGVSAFLIWKQGWQLANVKRALGVFAVQLILNALWSPLFFGVKDLGLAFVVIVAMWFAILASLIVFGKISRVAAALLAPYLLWVSFAAYLNYAIWMLNS